ncbi:hypothetical protein Vadar_010663 [Vaccinium darrowii]|uniref:Uncharacterized protein n=1 Tax=Vaccinium darrowii TaxID=229202 RepID=A0ACB7WZF5_9ERIC|nr:hypothetical protein Vadar_010663 [Vaccinium darrowii]
MEPLIRRTRVRFYGVGDENKEESNNIRDRSMPPQKTQSFKGEKRKTQSWFQRQFSRQMSQDFDLSNGEEYAAAVAAAAYAIMLEELSIAEQKRKSEEADTYLTKIKSRTEDTSIREPEAGKISRRSSGELSMTNVESPEKVVPVSSGKEEKIPEKTVRRPSIKKTASFADKPSDTTASRKPESEEKIPEKAVRPSPSIKKTASFADKPSDTTASRKPESASPPPFPPTDIRRQSSTRTGIVKTEADAWEEEEMAKIEERYNYPFQHMFTISVPMTICLQFKTFTVTSNFQIPTCETRVCITTNIKSFRYEKLSTTIQEWESRKKAKAKRQRDRNESELERKRAKAMQRYRSEMENIAKIAGGARAQAEENRRNEEFKVKEKANKIRSTGKIPPTCLCF